MFEIFIAVLTNPIFIIFSLCFIILILFFRKPNKLRKVPPGPKGIPIIGNNVPLKPNAIRLLNELTKQYGPIYEFKFFGQPIIVLGNYEIIKEAFLQKGTAFSGRPEAFQFQWYSGNGGGLIFSRGHLWKEQRRFALTTLKDFGFGKASLENRIIHEANFMINELIQKKSLPFDPQILLCKTVSNIIMSLTCNERMEYNNKTYENLLKSVDGIVNGFTMTNPINFFPPLRYFLKKWKTFVQSVASVRTYFQDIIADHEKSFDANNKRDYIDVFLEKMNDDKYKNVTESTFSRLQLHRTIDDFFLAGTETTATTLRWAFLFMMHYPDIQTKVREEIDYVIGSSRSPSMADKSNLPFTDATIMEVQRHANVIPLAVAHTLDRDINLWGYDIPKNAYIIPNLIAVHFDPKYWENPHKFDPTRFLDSDGLIKKNVESFIPFSIGKRVCLGESLAKMEVFLFFTCFCQRFIVKAPPNGYIPPATEYIEGGALRPLPYEMCVVPR